MKSGKHIILWQHLYSPCYLFLCICIYFTNCKEFIYKWCNNKMSGPLSIYNTVNAHAPTSFTTCVTSIHLNICSTPISQGSADKLCVMEDKHFELSWDSVFCAVTLEYSIGCCQHHNVGIMIIIIIYMIFSIMLFSILQLQMQCQVLSACSYGWKMLLF